MGDSSKSLIRCALLRGGVVATRCEGRWAVAWYTTQASLSHIDYRFPLLQVKAIMFMVVRPQDDGYRGATPKVVVKHETTVNKSGSQSSGVFGGQRCGYSMEAFVYSLSCFCTLNQAFGKSFKERACTSQDTSCPPACLALTSRPHYMAATARCRIGSTLVA